MRAKKHGGRPQLSIRHAQGSRWLARWTWRAVAALVVIAAAVSIAMQFRPRGPGSELPGVDLSGLNAQQIDAIRDYAAHERCPCGSCSFTLGECRHRDPTCPESGPLLQAVVDRYRKTTPADTPSSDVAGHGPG
jgi:hypothetical protein